MANDNFNADALRRGLDNYDLSQLTTLQTRVIAAKSSIIAAKAGVAEQKSTLETLLNSSGLASREAGLSAKLQSDRSIVGTTLSLNQLGSTPESRTQLGILTASIDLSNDLEDQLLENILFDLNRYRYLIAELGAQESRYDELISYYDKVLDVIAQSLASLP